jgi:nucleoid-associated protein YgaU
MSSRSAFRVDQPQPNDLVGNPVLVAGLGGGFEATLDLRVLDAQGQVLVEKPVTARNLTSAWQASVRLPRRLRTTRGVVEVGPSTGADEAPARVSVPVFFGTEIVTGFASYFLHVVQQGETLSSIADDAGELYIGSGPQPIFQANRDIIADPDLIYPGQVLRIPSNF